ncbi:uncharacterized protein F5891DRAFT_1254141 [Suillus fuscotomentosus]|uniref:Uncharacterized protein n=1 Tax=Suillus fuscotomentosus TaxID=1912939 RepID=A0AAD4DMQ3_9AGAM|nr:uncharacterized protein F5891DRAFT_1254141 [Suillus fuscotomentosus]KAG1879262.1 hypothetical protein F5891DRAFT_1254141 [Suillus fuscotomentosus]
MPILVHLDQLTSAPREYTVQNFNDTKRLDRCIMPNSFASPRTLLRTDIYPQSTNSPRIDHDVNDDLEKDFRTSITDVFITGQKLSLSPPEHLIGRLSRNLMIVTFSKPQEVSSMHATLPDDAISGELADLVGFDDIEIVAELLASRSYFLNVCRSVVTASLSPQDVRRRMEETLRVNASRPLFTGVAVVRFLSLVAASQEYEEVILTPSRVIPPRKSERLILVNELDELIGGSFLP